MQQLEVRGGLNVSQEAQLLRFEPNTQGAVNWELQTVGPTATFPLDNMMIASLAAFYSNGPLCLGGNRDYNSSGTADAYVIEVVVDEVVSYNFANQTWNSQSVPQSLPTKFYIGGQGQYFPNLALQGVNIFSGDYGPSDGGVAAAGGVNDIASLNSIVVYDVQSNQLFTQFASSAPIGRFEFCSVGVGNNSASSTYEM